MAAKFQYPFQCIQYLKGPAPSSQKFFVASAGPKLYSFSAEDGRRLFIWPRGNQSSNGAQSTAAEERGDADSCEPPEKKRRISPSADQSNGHADSNPDDKEHTHSGKPSASWSTIPIVVASPTGRHIIAVTGEDKCLRVFEIGPDGSLVQLSERCMPKRPSAVTLTPDGNTILCGDKFGDVYALPLIPSDKPKVRKSSKPKPFQPSATTLTVHTKRNLEALEQQLRQQNSQQKSEEKTVPTFERNLLLGHVSMLTDLAFVSVSSRDYILTADRDEHIRVSRGPPQTHIIENYCLGHSSFISRICIPQSFPELLISGGGDDHLLVWDWRAGQVLQKVSLSESSPKEELAVRGIWAIPLEARLDMVFVALEGSCELLGFLLQPNGEMRRQQSLQLPGNVLDVTHAGNSDTIVISVDGVHESGSTKAWKDNTTELQILVQAFRIKFQEENIAYEPAITPIVDNINRHGTEDILKSEDETSRAKEQKMLSESLYNIGNLRKRGQGDD
ncbi:hypothetical protein VTN77DRAFT_4195 [Rasamsonia byssochlamydoides]|uniref:uncharacterized protein n=1 Tax=Rasamsonia byssochlamydoides TaxID=89139 RepID=UPI003742B1EF